jgi:hypothetical protein
MNSFTSAFGPSGGGGLPLTGGTLTGALTTNVASGNIYVGQLSGVEKFKVDSTGRGSFSGGDYNVPWISTLNGFVGLGAGNSFLMQFIVNTVEYAALGTANFHLGGSHALSWSEQATVGNISTIRAQISAPAATTNTIQLGANAASGTNQTIKACNGTAGSGGNLTLAGGTGTTTAGGVAIGTNGTASVLIRHGTATLVAGTVTVLDTNIVAGSRIFVNRQTDGGTHGDSYSITRVAGTSFTITSKLGTDVQTGDTSIVSYLIINP